MICDRFDPITFSAAPSCCVCSNRHRDCLNEKETAADAANIDGGRVERDLQDRFSTSNNNEKMRRLQV